ncbi:MAG TPA: DNA mismatch repair protein MutS, partial [Limnochordia bacterium]|nr:DNA mismatch repair protein MutS [Limnochordia bacterium]
AVAMIRKDRDALLTMYGWIGELDALQAVASFRESLPYYCEPVLKQGRESTEKLVGEEMYHPLLQDPVPNSLTVGNQGILITGSNMSGKSTFLRTVGTNALFAQTIYTCLAQAYRSQFVKLLTSIGRADNIIEGKSYYLVEAQSILRVLKAIEAESSVTVMAIFDEMYRGTNSEERIKAGCRVLEYAAQPGTIILVATHDLELTKMLEQGYANYHFGEKVGGHGLEFDYTLKLGPSQTRNAITLLKALGYPQAITD